MTGAYQFILRRTLQICWIGTYNSFTLELRTGKGASYSKEVPGEHKGQAEKVAYSATVHPYPKPDAWQKSSRTVTKFFTERCALLVMQNWKWLSIKTYMRKLYSWNGWSGATETLSKSGNSFALLGGGTRGYEEHCQWWSNSGLYLARKACNSCFVPTGRQQMLMWAVVIKT